MIPTGSSLHQSRLRILAGRARTTSEVTTADERCELCGQIIGAEHRHVFDERAGELRCTCGACAILFDRVEAGGGHYRAVPTLSRRVVDFDIDDVGWAALGVPIGLAFFVEDTSGAVTAWYPNPLGMTRSSPDLAVWRELRRANPILERMEPDVEALLACRRPPEAQYWVVPIDVCYRLAALVRRRWEGFTGGPVWAEIDGFFDGVARKARLVDKNGAAVRATSMT